MNLENLNVTELGAQEKVKTEGGLTGLEVLGLVAAVITIGQAVDWIAGEVLEGVNNPA